MKELYIFFLSQITNRERAKKVERVEIVPAK